MVNRPSHIPPMKKIPKSAMGKTSRKKQKKDPGPRYGFDELTYGLCAALLVFLLLVQVTGLSFFALLGMIVLFYGYYRVLSRNLTARQRENDWFLDWWHPFSNHLWDLWDKAKGAGTHCRLRCPFCRKTLSMPKGRGTIGITCPHCGETFIDKT